MVGRFVVIVMTSNSIRDGIMSAINLFRAVQFFDVVAQDHTCCNDAKDGVHHYCYGAHLMNCFPFYVAIIDFNVVCTVATVITVRDARVAKRPCALGGGTALTCAAEEPVS